MPVTYTFTGVDASVWPIVGAAAATLTNPLRLAEEPTGLAGVEPHHDDDQNVDQAGATWRAAMFEPNIIGLLLHFGPTDPGDAALVRYMAFRDSLGDGRKVGEFRVAGPRRTTFQMVRLVGEPPPIPKSSLLQIGAALKIPVQLRSDESWWRTVPYEHEFLAAAFTGATIDNLADEDAWAYYEITGPITNPAIGLAGESVVLPSIAAGQTWKIDTDPNHFRITDHTGADRTFWGGVSLPGRWYVNAPAGTEDIALTITGTGTSGATKVKVILPQMYRSAL